MQRAKRGLIRTEHNKWIKLLTTYSRTVDHWIIGLLKAPIQKVSEPALKEWNLD